MFNAARERYQHGSIRRVKRAKGFAWEFRYYVRKRGKRHLKTQTFDGAVYKTEKALRQHLESFVFKLNETTEYARSAEVTFNALLRTSQSNRDALRAAVLHCIMHRFLQHPQEGQCDHAVQFLLKMIAGTIYRDT
jgi:hypothetical protein